jgi:hypothetical protein
MKGFKSFANAAVTIAGVELAHRIHKHQFSLGLKGSLNEYELDLLRQRSLEARHAKAKRGELIVSAPVGYRKTEEQRLEKDPDRRVQEAIPSCPTIETTQSCCFAKVEVQRSTEASMTADRPVVSGRLRGGMEQSIFQTLMIALSVVVLDIFAYGMA